MGQYADKQHTGQHSNSMNTLRLKLPAYSIFAVAITAALLISFLPHENHKMLPQSEISEKQPIPVAPIIRTHEPVRTAPDIVLHGTFINNLTQQALISERKQAQRWFNPKQYINNDFYLDGIFKDHIVVRDSGNTMSLEIRITTGGATQELAADSVPAMPAHAWVESLPPVPGIERLESNHYRVKRDLVMKELQAGEIFKQVRIVPEETGGFYINRIRRGSMTEVIGLHVGDTIHKINGKPLTNITDVLDLYKDLDNLEKVDVEINRMNEVQQLHYELN